jgi:hypothetical protein
MRPLNRFVLIGAACLSFLACQKELSSETPNEQEPPITTKTCNITRWVQGVDNGGPDDTVYLFRHDQNGRLTAITDSVSNETYFLNYSNGKLVKIKAIDHAFPTDTFDLMTYTYKVNGLLEQVKGDRPERTFSLEYSGADTLPSILKITSVFDPTDTSKYRLTWQSGNLKLVELLWNGVYEKSEEYTYTTIPNTFKTLALADFSGYDFGFGGAGLHFFNKNMQQKATFTFFTNLVTVDYNYTRDSLGNITSAISPVVTNGAGGAVNSRFMFYNCK